MDWLERPEDWDILPLRERREVAQEVVDALPGCADALKLRRAASFLRTAGWGEEALAAAQSAFTKDPSWASAIVLAGSHRFLDQVDEAVRMYDVARRLQPEDRSVLLDLGDMLGYEQTRPEEALAAYEEFLAAEPGHPWAWPAWLFLQAEQGDEDAGERLLELAADQPENAQAFRLAMAWRFRELPFWGCLPESWGEGDGTLPLADWAYHAQFWGAAARVQGLRLKDDETLLTILDSDAPLKVQLAAAMILSRSDEEWEGSGRRDILLALLDEAHPAAIVAAGRLAFDEPATRPELVECLRDLRAERPDRADVLDPVLAWFEPDFLE